MPNSQPNGVIQLIRKFAEAECTRKLTDRQLLERFLVKHDEAAFAALVRRHGPMVLRLCRRVLQNEDDAEDAFQATFLVLSRQVSSLRQHESLVGWFHSVAYRVAQKARIAAARRRKHEGRAPERQVADPLTEITLREAHEVFDRELNRLPDKFRAPLVLCYLEGLTRDEAAQHLGWPPSTLKSRLEQARERLRVRLESRGLALAGALVASLFHESTASATVPCALLGSTVKAAITVAAGEAATSVVSANVVALAEGVVKAMFITKLSVATVLVSGILFVAAAGTIGFRAVAADQPAAPAAKGQEVPKAAPPEAKREPADEKRQRTEEDLKKLLKDKDEEVRKAAIEALKKFDKDGVLAALKADDPEVRLEAAKGLGKIADVRLEAAKGLGKIIVVKNCLLTGVDAKLNTISVRIAGVTPKRVWTDLAEVKDKGLTPGGLYLSVDGKLLHLPIESARLEGLPLAKNAKITINGKEAAIADLKLPSLITFSLVTNGEKIEVGDIHAGK